MLTGDPNDGSLKRVMSQQAIIEVFLRGGAVATLLLCAVLFACRYNRGRKDVSVAVLCMSLCAYLLVSSPSIALNSGLIESILVAISGAVPVLVYWAALELFQDDVQFKRWQLILAVLIVTIAWASQVEPSLGAYRGTFVLVLFVHLLFVVLTGVADDLVEARRRFRHWFATCLALIVAIITILEVTGADNAMPLWVFALHASVFWVLAAAFLIWAVQVDPVVWIAPEARPIAETEMTPAEIALAHRIETAMTDGMWRQEGLTVAQMAQHLGTQEHRLRKTINQRLGYRNFSSFINTFRVTEAQAILQDPAHAERTVLSIAYDVGFSSLGPFNRAFRAHAGMTPSEFRKTNGR